MISGIQPEYGDLPTNTDFPAISIAFRGTQEDNICKDMMMHAYTITCYSKRPKGAFNVRGYQELETMVYQILNHLSSSALSSHGGCVVEAISAGEHYVHANQALACDIQLLCRWMYAPT